MSKAAEAFRNISEVAQELGVKKHVLRFWEVKFPQIKLAGASCATGATRPDRTRRQALPSPDPAPSVRLSAAEFGALRSIAAELDTCRTMLAGAVGVVPPEAHERIA